MAVVVASCPNRAHADLLVEVLAGAGVRAVAFVDVERSPDGHVFRESADVRVAADDVARAEAALAAWDEARRAGIDDDELERQALEAGADAGSAAVDAAVDDAVAAPEVEAVAARGGDDRRRSSAPVAPRAPSDACPYCGATVRPPWSSALARAFAALAGRARRDGAERLCTACGHRWRPDGPAASR
ncbi:MAG: hypothetical protein U1E39_00855 [Planctomycetota bacterium]